MVNIDKIKSNSPFWHSVIGNETGDNIIANKEQFNLSIRWVNNLYEIFEVPVGLYCLPNTTADTIAKVVKDILIHYDLPLSLCRGQAYNGVTNISGIRTGISTRIQKETPAALRVHCFAHSLNLCLQDAGRQIVIIRDVFGIVKDIVQLIKLSPKRSNLFWKIDVIWKYRSEHKATLYH